MKLIKRNYFIDNFLKKINDRIDYATERYSKSIVEFNPSENNYIYGYMKACEQIKKDFLLSMEKGDDNIV